MKALKSLLKELLNLDNTQVISSNEPFLVGDAPFITVDLESSQPSGVGKCDYNGNGEIETIRTSFTSVVNLRFFGTNAYQMAVSAQAVMQSSHAQAQLHKLKAAMFGTSAIRDLSASVGAGYEERAGLELYFSHTHITTTSLRRIEEVSVSVDADYLQQEIIIKEK